MVDYFEDWCAKVSVCIRHTISGNEGLSRQEFEKLSRDVYEVSARWTDEDGAETDVTLTTKNIEEVGQKLGKLITTTLLMNK